MAHIHATFPASKLSQSVTMHVRVTGMRVVKARWWVASWLMFLAARVAGCRIDVEVSPR